MLNIFKPTTFCIYVASAISRGISKLVEEMQKSSAVHLTFL